MTTDVTVPSPDSYPLHFDIAYPERLSRWMIFVKWLLAIPHYIIIYALDIIFRILTLIAFFAILFTRQYPESLFKFNVGIRRWEANVGAYVSLMRDEYPPFSFDPGQYAVAFDVQYPQELSRWAPLYKWLLAIPHYIVLIFLGIAAAVVIFVAFFIILFTAKYPESLFRFVVGVNRWVQRVNAYVLLMRDEYPPFSMEP